MIWQSLEQITKGAIESLLEEKVREDGSLEYKRELPTGDDKNKKEFCADISAFANASGGYILYGIEEKDGLPASVTGIGDGLDGEVLRLRQIAEHHIEPRIPGLGFKIVEGFDSGSVLVVSIPKSWAGPHRVKDHDKAGLLFYLRSGPGKRLMDLPELRSSFLLADGLSDKIRRFRDVRLSNIISGETPILLSSSPKIVVHLIPLNSLLAPTVVDFDYIQRSDAIVYPLGCTSRNRRYNLDGLVWHWSDQNPRAYAQLFRDGRIETVNANLVENNSIAPYCCEKETIKFCKRYVDLMPNLFLPFPVIVLTSLIGVKGCTLCIKQTGVFPEDIHPVDRDILLLPDVILQEETDDMATVLRPIFDALWNAGGYCSSKSYDQNGVWHDRH